MVATLQFSQEISMNVREFKFTNWTAESRVDCPDGKGLEVLCVDFTDTTVLVRIGETLESWYSHKEVQISTEKAVIPRKKLKEEKIIVPKRTRKTNGLRRSKKSNKGQ